MSLNAVTRRRLSLHRAATHRLAWRDALALPCAVVLVVALALPLLFASPANLTSDESLYYAEAYNIAHGEGLTYPSGEAITHRAPLYPLLMAPALRLAGSDGAYAVAKAMVVVNALLVMALAWRAAGGLAGTIAGVTAAAASYLNGLGTTLYLDPMQCALLLGALLALQQAMRDARLRWWALSGAAVGLAFLVKESAVQWAPLGVAAWLAVPSLRGANGTRGAFAFTAMLAAVVAPWWAWVYAHDGDLFMLGDPSALTIGLICTVFVALGLFGLVAWRAPMRIEPAPSLRVRALLALVVAWGGFMFYGLTVYSTWPYPNDLASTLPRYATSVMPQAQPYFLLVAAWGWAIVRARRDEHVRLLLIAAALLAPFALFAANRGLQLRDLLPLVYVSYVLLGLAAADVIRTIARVIDDATGEMFVYGALAVALVAFAAQQTLAFRDANAAAAAIGVRVDNWESPFVRDSAAWIEANLPESSRLLTSRLYFSSLHVETDAQFEIRQLPTVRVDVDASRTPMLDARSNLFRWGDDDLRATQPEDRWLSLKQFPGKDYWIGINQQELYAYIAEHESDYLVLTGEDVAFSSLSYASVLTAHPAFRLIHWERATAGDQLFVYAIDHSRLAVVDAPLAISPRDLASLSRETGLNRAGIEAALGQPLRVTDANWGLSEREQYVAVASETSP